jgi:hypothetical protein
MKIKYDEQGYVIGFVIIGDMEDAIEYDGSIPDDFTENYFAYKLVDGELVLDNTKLDQFTIKKNAFERLMQLKEAIQSTDYKIIKSYEYSLAGLDLPYNIQLLHEERQAIRDEINEIELLLGIHDG